MAVDTGTELEEALSRWELDAAAVRARMYRAPTLRERERWQALDAWGHVSAAVAWKLPD
jgi:hypothetical protein